MKFRFRIIRESLDESAKTDFVDKFGQDKLDVFDKARQRMKNKNLSVDYQSYLKMTPEELDDLILSLYDKESDAQKKRMLQGKDKEIRGKYNYLGRYGDYEVYQPLDYISSMDLGVNTGWCTTGRYGHAGHPEFAPSEVDAKRHFNEYTSRGVNLYYFLDPQTMYGRIAIAVYPKMLYPQKRVDQGDKIIYLKNTNFEIFDAEDVNDYSLLSKIPEQLIDKFNLKIDYDVVVDFSGAKEINIKKSDKISCDLLGIEEARLVPKKIREYIDWWWLRSPGDISYHAAVVNDDGSVDDLGNYVDDCRGVCVRPALHILNLDSLNLKVYEDIIKVLDKYWIYIGENKALLMGEPLAKMVFRKDWKAKDANDYKKSNVKTFLDSWIEEQKEKYSK